MTRPLKDKKPNYFVGIGASAGGLEAIENFFSNMSATSGLTFIVIQHLSPDYKSLMVELLSKRTKLKVQKAEDGLQLKANNVYLIPPKKNLSIFHGKLLLSDQDQGKGLNLPIDIFFRSLAEDQGDKAIGIILSGSGSDGMRGVRAIKEYGGLVMVQDEESAKFDGMPRSAISTGLPDYILHPQEMPQQLLSYIKHPYSAKPKPQSKLLTDEDNLARIFSLIREKHKIDFSAYKLNTVIRRIERRMSINQINELKEYVRFIENTTSELSVLYHELLIGVTNFFRDKEAFKILESKFLTELIRSKESKKLRFWVAGCSSGEEAYSIAMMVNSILENLDEKKDIKIFATDVDENAILRAGGGIFPESIAADISPEYLSKYFRKIDGNFQVQREIREMVVFAHHNLLKDPPFTNIDFISCRNLLIYIQSIYQRKVLNLFNFSLNPGGILFLGSSETIGDMFEYFEPLDKKWQIFRSKGVRRHPTEIHLNTGNIKPKEKEIKLPKLADTKHLHNFREEKLLERLFNGLYGDYLPLVLVVNDSYELLHVLGDASEFLKFPSGKVHFDVTKMTAKEISIPIATGLQKAFKNKSATKYSNIKLREDGVTRIFNIEIKPLPSKQGQQPLSAILVDELVPSKDSNSEQNGTTYDIEQETEQRINDLEQELQFTRENLQATIEELETSNEELQATNEELVASNEELQSTNEELQSVNEELHTVNSEHQLRIMELTEANNDMINLLDTTQIGTLFFDENLELRKISSKASEILNIGDKYIGKTAMEISDKIDDFDFMKIISRVNNTEDMHEEEFMRYDKKWFVIKVTPYHITERTISGIIVTIIETTKAKQTLNSLQMHERWTSIASQIAGVGYWEYDIAQKKQTWSSEIFKIHDLSADNTPDVVNGMNYYIDEHKPIIEKAFNELCINGKSYDLVLKIKTESDNIKWIRTIGKAKMNGSDVVKVFGAFQDISFLKEKDTRLVHMEELYHELSDSRINAVLTLKKISSRNILIQDVNDNAAKLFGIKRSDAIGKKLDSIIMSEGKIKLSNYINRVDKTHSPIKIDKTEYRVAEKKVELYSFIFKLPSDEIAVVFDSKKH